MIPSLYYKYVWQGIFILTVIHLVFYRDLFTIPDVYLGTPETLFKILKTTALFSIWSTLGIWFYPYMAFVTMNPCSRSQSSDRSDYAGLYRLVMFILVHSIIFLLSPVLGFMVYRKSRKRRMAKKAVAQGTVRKSVVLEDAKESDIDALEDVAEVNPGGGRYIKERPESLLSLCCACVQVQIDSEC